MHYKNRTTTSHTTRKTHSQSSTSGSSDAPPRIELIRYRPSEISTASTSPNSSQPQSHPSIPDRLYAERDRLPHGTYSTEHYSRTTHPTSRFVPSSYSNQMNQAVVPSVEGMSFQTPTVLIRPNSFSFPVSNFNNDQYGHTITNLTSSNRPTVTLPPLSMLRDSSAAHVDDARIVLRRLRQNNDAFK